MNAPGVGMLGRIAPLQEPIPVPYAEFLDLLLGIVNALERTAKATEELRDLARKAAGESQP